MEQGLLQNVQYLERTFARLRQLESSGEGRVALLHFGASHTAVLTFAERLRARLAGRFGDLGPGYVPAATMRPVFAAGELPVPQTERGQVTLQATGPWERETALKAKPHEAWSLAGSRLWGEDGAQLVVDFCPRCATQAAVSGPDAEPDAGDAAEQEAAADAAAAPDAATDAGDAAETDAAAGPAARAARPGRVDVFFLAAPGMPSLTLTLGAQQRTVSGARVRASAVQVESFEVEGAPPPLQVAVAGRGRVALLGVVYERKGSGLVYDVLGLSGSSAYVAERYEKAAFTRQLAARQPTLLVFFYGTNESVMANVTGENYRRRYLSHLRTARSGPQRPDCLLISNTDREVPDGEGWKGAPNADLIERTIARVAKEAGCAYWSSRQAMGGAGGMRRWLEHEPPHALADRAHLTETGYQALADALAHDLLNAFDAWKAAR